jgi:mannose-6-phosphate isomerase-like protein (cupin superfamily)
MTIKVLIPRLKGKLYMLSLNDQGYLRYIFRRTPEDLIKAFSDTLENYRNPKPRDNWKRSCSEFHNRSFGSQYMRWDLRMFEIVDPNSTPVVETIIEQVCTDFIFDSFMDEIMWKVKKFYEQKQVPPPGFKLLKRVTKKTSDIRIKNYGDKSSWLVWGGTKEEFVDKFWTIDLQTQLLKNRLSYNTSKKRTGELSLCKTPVDTSETLIYFHGEHELSWGEIRLDGTGNYLYSSLPKLNFQDGFLFFAQEFYDKTTTDLVYKQCRELFDSSQEAIRKRLSMEVVTKPWGTYTVLFESSGCKVKHIKLNPQSKISLQSHFKRSEVWIVISGKGIAIVEQKVWMLNPNSMVTVAPGEKHRMITTKEPMEIIEVQTGVCEEEDIVRYEDEYGRV